MVMIPSAIKCPSCGETITDIDVKAEGDGLYFNGCEWVWKDPQNITLSYFCSECGEELPISDELELIVQSAR